MILLSCFASILLLASKIRQIQPYEEENKSSASIIQSVPLSSKCSSSSADRSLLFVSTADGKFTCLNALDGNILWSLPETRSLVSSSISVVKSIQDLTEVRLIPSLNGNLYKWTGEKLETVPLSADYLLGHIKKLPDGSLVVGGNEVTIHGIDIATGEVSYECSLTGCKPVEDAKDIKHKDILSLRRTQKTIRVLESRTGREKWNFSVGNFEIELFEGENSEITLDCDHISEHVQSINFLMQDGIVSNNDAHHSWTFKFKSPIAGAWRLDDDKLKLLNIFDNGLFEGLPDEKYDLDSLMYLGIHEGQMYIQQPPYRNLEDVNTFSNEFISKTDKKLPQIGYWRPLISTSPSRTPFLNNEKTTALSSLGYPFDNGFFLLSNTTALALPLPIVKETEKCSSEDPDICVTTSDSTTEGYDLAPLTIQDWWKEILALSFIIAVGLNISVRVLKRRLGLLAISEEETLVVEAEEAMEEVPEQITTKHVKTNSVSIATSPIEEIVMIDEAGSSTATLTSTTSEYSSRYMVDFEHLACLGKGGFGVVFKAKKKIDDCEYAIKRIYLPRCDEAKLRMMREVKALAALEHPGIVRYFHAWWEEPPKGWQLETDRQYLMKDMNDTPSYALSEDWMIEVDTSPNDTSINNKSSKNCELLKKGDLLNGNALEGCYNFATGTEDLLSRNNIDLLRNNDVFYSDESLDALSSNSDSFIMFEGADDSDNHLDYPSTSMNSDCQNNVDNINVHKRTVTLTAEEENEDSFIVFESNDNENKNIEEKDNTPIKPSHNTSVSSKDGQKSRRRVVGKCCTRSSTCLKDPPLFLYIQMQLCKHQNLKDWLTERASNICFPTSYKVFMQIVNAVEYFHCQGMMHRDLKPANIFFSLDGSVKVGDFGLVTAITRPSRGKHKNGYFQDENHTGQVGTQLYMSPEQAGGKPYSQKVDLYALGLILFELICYFSTQMERMQLLYGLKSGDLPKNLADTPQGKLVKLLTSEEQSVRPEAKEIKGHQLTLEMLEFAERITTLS